MSMNQVHDELKSFKRELEQFHSVLKSSRSALQREHDAVASIWQDSFRKTYDRQWQQFGRNVDQYLDRDAGSYVNFLDQKIRQLAAYLHG